MGDEIMPTIQTTYVCKSGPHKGKMLAVVLDDNGNPIIQTNKPTTAEEIITALRPVLRDNGLLKQFAKKLQDVKP